MAGIGRGIASRSIGDQKEAEKAFDVFLNDGGISRKRGFVHEDRFTDTLHARKDQYIRQFPADYVTTKNLIQQHNWHPMFRDNSNMMYRTSYRDHIGGLEISCKSTHPAGYGGHVMRKKHDVLFKNTDFDEVEERMMHDPERDKLPDFSDQLLGLPTTTLNPRGAKNVPTYKSVPTNAICALRDPWASTGLSPHSILSYRKDIPLLPKQRPYELPPMLHPSGAMTERKARPDPKPEAPEAPEMPAEIAPSAEEEQQPEKRVVIGNSPRMVSKEEQRRALLAARNNEHGGNFADTAPLSTTGFLKSSLMTPRRLGALRALTPPRQLPADDSSVSPRMHMISSTRASYILTGTPGKNARERRDAASISPR